jgi:hypothetical protein
MITMLPARPGARLLETRIGADASASGVVFQPDGNDAGVSSINRSTTFWKCPREESNLRHTV